eukprot:6783645-Prymnesium_polylepis.1
MAGRCQRRRPGVLIATRRQPPTVGEPAAGAAQAAPQAAVQAAALEATQTEGRDHRVTSKAVDYGRRGNL